MKRIIIIQIIKNPLKVDYAITNIVDRYKSGTLLCINICNIYLIVKLRKYITLYKLQYWFFLYVQVLANVVRQHVKTTQQFLLRC